MNKKKHKEFEKSKIGILLILFMILLMLALIGIVISNNNLNRTEPLAVNDIITATSEIESTQVDSHTEEVKVKAVDEYTVIQKEIELLKGKDTKTIERYFGNSDVFTGDAVSDKVKSTVITFISQPSNEEVIVHICSLDYDKLKEASVEVKHTIENNEINNGNIDDTVKKEVAKGVIKGQYDIHYNIPVILKDNKVVITENIKQAITGNWYNGINTHMESVECPIESSDSSE